ncbi:MAG: serine/threonine-protein kinase [Sandaracinus sp.]
MSEARGSPFEPGIRLGDRYRLGERLAAGGVGQIFEAIDERLDRRVAVKVVRTPGLADRATLARLEREARAAARIHHPNIVDVTDFGTTAEGYPFLVMERLEGETLEERIAQGPLPVSLAVELHVQLLDALAAAHGAGVLHRDVKPANVLVGALPSGATVVTLLDFGLAALAESAGTSKLTDGGVVLGSPAYLAPERLLGQPADVRADLYAVGVCLFEALTGERPFEAPSALVLRGRVLTEEAPRVRGTRPEVGPALDDLVARALAKSPTARFGSAEEMRDALRGLGSAGAQTLRALEPVPAAAAARPSPARESLVPPVARPRRSVGWLALGMALVLVVAVLVALASARPSPPESPSLAAAPPPPAPVASVPSAPAVSPVAASPRVPTEVPVAPPSAPPALAEPVVSHPPRPTVARRPPPPPSTETAPAPAAPAPVPTPSPAIDRPIEPVW